MIVDVLMGRCSSMMRRNSVELSSGVQLHSDRVDYESSGIRYVYAGLIRLSALPLFIFSQPDICISHKLPQRVLWSEAEMKKAW